MQHQTFQLTKLLEHTVSSSYSYSVCILINIHVQSVIRIIYYKIIFFSRLNIYQIFYVSHLTRIRTLQYYLSSRKLSIQKYIFKNLQ